MNNMKKLLWTVFSTFVLFIWLVLPIASATNAWIYDENGRAVLLHGVSVSNIAKRTPDHMSWHTFDDYEHLIKDWGFNTIRFLIFWSAIEPEPGVYNETYLDEVEKRLEWAESLGIYVILDMHQDLYGKKYEESGGDGAPVWATWDDDIPLFHVDRNKWVYNYLQPAIRLAFTNFWIEDELQNHFVSMWVHVVDRFKDNSAVLGYDLLNEPFFGNILPPSLFESVVLKNFYLKLICEMKKVDPDGLFFYQPQITASAGIKSYMGVLPQDNLVYAPHFYCFGLCDRTYFVNERLLQRNTEAETACVPWIIGEFAVRNNTFNRNDFYFNGDKYLINVLANLDSHMAGWIYWNYDYKSHDSYGILEDNGNERAQLQYLVYPYPQKIAGNPIKFSYSYENKSCYVEFEENENADGPTKIFVGQERIYPEGFVVTCSDPEGTWFWEYDPDYDVIEVWTNSEIENHWILVKPNISSILLNFLKIYYQSSYHFKFI
ncbi:MAG: cellulase family glycosylhydrolase [Thermoplasmatales archaeon]|nr:MAG: cellulase family glycosylhydrolase [Thermoplasmatales archaeon]